MAMAPPKDRQAELIPGGLAAAVITLVIGFGGLAFLEWVTGRNADMGLGPDFLYLVLLPITMAGLAWIAFRSAWKVTSDPADDPAGRSRRAKADSRAAIVAPLLALAVNQIVWTVSLDHFDWLGAFIGNPFNSATRMVLMVFPLLLVGVTIRSGIAAQTLMTPSGAAYLD